MEFGDRSRFAIAIELDANYGGPWLFGRIAYWASGLMIGNYALGTSLRDVLFQMTFILGSNAQRDFLMLFHLDKDKIFSLIQSALEETDDAIYEHLPKYFPPAQFDVRIPVDVFDSCKIFLVESDPDAKLLYQKLDSPAIMQTLLRKGEFDEAFINAYKYLDQIYEKEVSLANR